MRFRGLSVAAAILMALIAPGQAETRPDLTGYYKNFFSLTDAHDNLKRAGLTDRGLLVDDVQRLRLKLDYAPVEWGDLLVHYEARAAWGDTVRVLNREMTTETPAFLGNSLFASGRARFLDLDDDLIEESNFTLSHGLDRLRLRAFNQWVELAVGRQAVSWGVGLIWTPSDLFTGFAPNEIDRDEKLGVDVVRLIVSPTLGTSLDIVAEPLDTNRTYGVDKNDSALAARLTSHLGEYDLAALAGYIASDYVAGGDFSGYLWDAGFRGELVYTAVDESDEPDYLRGLLSLDYSFALPWDPYLAVEYFYNGLGEGDPDRYLTRLEDASVRRAFSRGTAFNLGRDYVGTIMRVLPSALLSAQAVTLVNVDDGSVLEFATLSYSLSDNSELIFGTNLGLGPLGTEFGGFSEAQAGVDFRTPDFYYAFFKGYF